MPGTTPVYGFPYPEPTDLVADYPALGQDLAEDIEAVLPTIGGLVPAKPTSIANSGGTATLSGNTITFSGVSSVSLNGCFTANYDNYRVLITITTTSVQADLTMRLRASGADATGSNYNYAWRGNNVTNAETSAGQNAQAQAVLGNIGLTSGTNVGAHYSLDVKDVFAARRSIILGQTLNSGPGVIVENVNVYGAIHTLANAYDGLTVYPASGTIGGFLSVYGYNK